MQVTGCRDVSLPALQKMLKGEQPQILVIVNRFEPAWVDPLSAYGALLAVVDVFRSERNVHVLRVNGDYPNAPGDVVSSLRFDPAMPRLTIVESPRALETPVGRLLLEYEGSLTEWTRIDAASLCGSARYGATLWRGKRCDIVRSEDGRLLVRRER